MLEHAYSTPPAASFGLKDVASAFGYIRTSTAWRSRRSTSRARLLTYNRDDLLSLKFVIDAVAPLCAELSGPRPPNLRDRERGP
jgi:hypothetical protein